MEEIQDKWKLWYHSINDTNWNKKSYQDIYNINNLFDYKYVIEIFKQDHYQNGMFFCMRDGIFPNWEDPDNRNGGCLSFKVSSVNILEEWNNLLLKCITDNILSDKNNEINGISISPKKEFNIIKIWFKDSTFNYKEYILDYNGHIQLKDSLYKKHDIN